MPVELAQVVDSPSRRHPRPKVDRAPWWSNAHFLCILGVLLGLVGTLSPKHGWIDLVRSLRAPATTAEASATPDPEEEVATAAAPNGWMTLRCKIGPDDVLQCRPPAAATSPLHAATTPLHAVTPPPFHYPPRTP